jgi:hypothetical protein
MFFCNPRASPRQEKLFAAGELLHLLHLAATTILIDDLRTT